MDKRLVVGGVVVVSTALATFISGREGTEYTPYRDVGGVWTVCQGITGPQVIPGRTYSKEECADLRDGAIAKHGLAVLECTKGVQLKQHEYEAYTTLAYNVGAHAVCASCLPGKECLGDLIRAGKSRQACERILAFAKVRISGELRDCSDRQWNCYGVWTRRQAEYRMCLGQS